MTIHVTIEEAQERLTELVAAVRHGEDVVLEAGSGSLARIVRTDDEASATASPTPEQIVARRLNTLGIWKDRVGLEAAIIPPSMTDQEVEERWNRKFGPAA